MKIYRSIVKLFCLTGIALVSLVSCEDFFDPEQSLVISSDQMFYNWEAYRSAGLGLYSIQQDLVDQLVVLGELRGDLLTVTDNASPDLIAVNDFNISRDNKYASPRNFYRLIGECNSLITQLETAHPEVLDKNESITNYDRLYGEALCMQAWAYFNAVRIYGRIPYIYKSLTDPDEIEAYVNSPGEYIDSIYIVFAKDGYNNDTTVNKVISLTKKYYDMKMVVDTFTYKLENNIKAVGVNHSVDNGDLSWSTTIWSDDARHVLLGQMYFFDGNYSKAMPHFNRILFNNTSETLDLKYRITKTFRDNAWQNIFLGINGYEHIFTLEFSGTNRQTNELQRMFDIRFPNKYMMKPTSSCVRYWESMFDDPTIEIDPEDPSETEIVFPGDPGDFFRGYGVSYKYYKRGVQLSADTVQAMLNAKVERRITDAQKIMELADTVVYKYSLGKNAFSNDANFIVYRAAGIHLYAAEIYAVWSFDHSGIVRPETNTSLNILNNGTYDSEDASIGIRGRVGFADGYEAIGIPNIIYQHDPETNEITGYLDYQNNLPAKQQYLTEKILDERARELAFEGERFYDLMRVAKRFDRPEILAERVSSKFRGAKRQQIYNHLMNPDNWYIDYFDE